MFHYLEHYSSIDMSWWDIHSLNFPSLNYRLKKKSILTFKRNHEFTQMVVLIFSQNGTWYPSIFKEKKQKTSEQNHPNQCMQRMVDGWIIWRRFKMVSQPSTRKTLSSPKPYAGFRYTGLTQGHPPTLYVWVSESRTQQTNSKNRDRTSCFANWSSQSTKTRWNTCWFLSTILENSLEWCHLNYPSLLPLRLPS